MALLKTSSCWGMLHSFLSLIRHEFLQNTCKRITLGFFIAFLNSLPLPNVTLFYFIIQLPILLSFAKQWQTIAWIRRFFSAYGCFIKLHSIKAGTKGQKLLFQPICTLTFTYRYTGTNKARLQNGGIMLWIWWYSYIRRTNSLLDVFLFLLNVILLEPQIIRTSTSFVATLFVNPLPPLS